MMHYSLELHGEINSFLPKLVLVSSHLPQNANENNRGLFVWTLEIQEGGETIVTRMHWGTIPTASKITTKQEGEPRDSSEEGLLLRLYSPQFIKDAHT